MKKIIVFICLSASNIFSQIIVNADSILFPQQITGSVDSVSVTIINLGENPAEIELKNLKAVYSLSDSILFISPLDSVILWIKYAPMQNIIDRDIILISSNDSTIGKIISLNGQAVFNDEYDATTFNLFDVQLKSTLGQLVSGHTSLGYNLARDKMYMEIDNKRVNGQGATLNTLECVYTGRLAVGYTSRTDAQNNFNFNTEHTWPQSTFNENEPMRSDLYHLYPTDINANSIRSNYPFGNVVSAITWDSAGSKLGRDTINQIVFEPRDSHKGDVSRSMLYFMIRYPQNYGGFLTSFQESVYREWNILDDVSTIEASRNEAIATLQQKRNPFIDHPEFVERIYSFLTNEQRPVFAEIDILPEKVIFDSTMIGNSSLNYFYIANKGSDHLIVDSILFSDQNFSVIYFPSMISPYSYEKVAVEFSPDQVTNYSVIVTVFSNGGQQEIILSGTGTENIVGLQNEVISTLSFLLDQNFPNPFNPGTIISWQVPVDGWQTLKIYDILGNEIAILIDEYRPAGRYTFEWDPGNISSGIYFYQLKADSFSQTRSMILMR